MRKVLLVGNFGAQNKGDELILQGLLALCKDLELVPVVVSHDPKGTASAYKVSSVSRLPIGFRSLFTFGWIKTLKEFRRVDYVILGGGGLFVDRFRRAVILWGLHGFCAILFRKPLFLLGHSFEIRRPFSQKVLRYICKKARIVVVRDKSSLDFLEKIGVAKEKCFRFPDMGFLNFTDREVHREPILGVTLCKWGLSPEKLKEISDFIRYVLNDSVREVLLFPFQIGNDNDLFIFSRLKKLVADDRVKIVDYDDPEFVSRFQKCAFILGMRLHSILLAFASRIPFAAISYQDKVCHSVADFGLDQYCMPVHSFTSQSLCDCFERAQRDQHYFDKYAYHESEMKKLTDTISSLL